MCAVEIVTNVQIYCLHLYCPLLIIIVVVVYITTLTLSFGHVYPSYVVTLAQKASSSADVAERWRGRREAAEKV